MKGEIVIIDQSRNYILKPDGDIKEFDEPHQKSLAEYLNNYYQVNKFTEHDPLFELVMELKNAQHCVYICLKAVKTCIIFTPKAVDIPKCNHHQLLSLITNNNDNEVSIMSDEEEISSASLYDFLINKKEKAMSLTKKNIA